MIKLTQATNGSVFWQARGNADWERRLAAPSRLTNVRVRDRKRELSLAL